MTLTGIPVTHRAAAALLVLSTLLTSWNWYLQPERSPAWTASLVLLACMALAFGLALVVANGHAARRHAAERVATGVVFAGLILTVALSMKLITELSGIATRDVSQRTTMLILGMLFVFAGNLLPKRLTPLAALRCDGARAQAAQRFAAWMSVLTGLAFSLIWLSTPLDVAEPLSVSVLLTGTLASVAPTIRLCWVRRRAA
jgi:hypothetical protein